MGNKENKQAKPVTIDYHYQKISIIWYIPLLLIAGFVPLIVYAKYVDLSGTMQALYWTGEQQYLDFFSYWKSQWVMWLTLAGMIIYGVLVYLKKLPFKRLWQYYIPMLIYCGCVILSTIFAKDVQTALWGFVDMYQGCFVLLAYMGILFLTINFVNSERELRWFAIAFLILMYAEGILGISQYFGFDLLQTKIGQSIILPNYIEVEGGLEFTFGPKTIYGTLFNTNYVGSFACLMLPMSVAFLCASKNWKERVVTGGAVVLMVFVWLGCNSRAGYLGVAVGAVLAVVMLRKAVFRYWKVSISVVVIMCLLGVSLNFLSGGALGNRVKSLNVLNMFDSINSINKSGTKIENVTVGKNEFSVSTNYETLLFKVEDNKMYFLDENNNELPIDINGENVTINNTRYSGYKIKISADSPIVTVSRDTYYRWVNIIFYIGNDKVSVISSGGRIAEPIKADSISTLDSYGRFASNRGYIWSRTIPILRGRIIFGVGADNYPLVFPQDDFAEKMKIGMDANMVIDKPHNMMLQIGVNTGMLSIVALLFVWIYYLIDSMKLFLNVAFDSYNKFIGVACLISITGYITAALFNDHIVSISPVFWMILGIGVCNNGIIRDLINKKE